MALIVGLNKDITTTPSDPKKQGQCKNICWLSHNQQKIYNHCYDLMKHQSVAHLAQELDAHKANLLLGEIIT